MQLPGPDPLAANLLGIEFNIPDAASSAFKLRTLFERYFPAVRSLFFDSDNIRLLPT